MISCYKCGGEIFFDEDCTSASGKKIPLDEEYDGGKMVPHDCPKSDFNRPSRYVTTQGMSLEKRVDALEKRIYDLEIGK